MDKVISVKEHSRRYTPQDQKRRKEICRKAAQARWAKQKGKIYVDAKGYEYKIKNGKKVLLNTKVIKIWD